jgi:NAD(P)-dependent dehydrogenase (short-subunit alcohol dehydrogenase family)
MGELNGNVAVITGGASGIGERSVRLFIEEGARVVIADMQEERGQALAAELGAASAVFARVEVRDEPQVKAAVELAVSRWGRLDCIFNNAGFGGVLGPIAEIPVDEFDMTFDVLVRGVFLGMKHAAPIMMRQKAGSIINTGSIAGLKAGYSPHPYAAAKAAVIHMSKSVAMEMGEHNVRVNAICPGFIATPLAANTVGRSDELVDRVKPAFAKAQAIPRAGEPDDIAQMACWLAGDRSTFVTGQHFVIDGGVSCGLKWADQPEFQKSYHPIKVYRPQ